MQSPGDLLSVLSLFRYVKTLSILDVRPISRKGSWEQLYTLLREQYGSLEARHLTYVDFIHPMDFVDILACFPMLSSLEMLRVLFEEPKDLHSSPKVWNRLSQVRTLRGLEALHLRPYHLGEHAFFFDWLIDITGADSVCTLIIMAEHQLENTLLRKFSSSLRYLQVEIPQNISREPDITT